MKIVTRIASTGCVLALGIVAVLAQAQNQPQGQTPRPANQPPNQQDQATEDFAAPAAFPLAAPAGVDSRAVTTAPANAVNTGPFDPATWKYGTASSSLWRAASHSARAGRWHLGQCRFRHEL